MCTRIAIFAALAIGWSWWADMPAHLGIANSKLATAMSFAQQALQTAPTATETPAAPNPVVLDYTAHVHAKYFILLHDVRLDAVGLDTLLARLAEREHIGNDFESPTRAQDLARADATIGSLLHPSDFAALQMLKDADEPLGQLRVYADGLEEVAPLSDLQMQALAMAKLQSLQAHGPVSPRTALALQQALQASRDEYLEMARSILTEEQFSLLRAYEFTEHELALAAATDSDAGTFVAPFLTN